MGSVDLDMPEYDVRVDENGEVISVSQIVRDRSHGLVEEFMLAANQVVARLLIARKLPGLSSISIWCTQTLVTAIFNPFQS